MLPHRGNENHLLTLVAPTGWQNESMRYALLLLCLSAGGFGVDCARWGDPVAGLHMAATVDRSEDSVGHNLHITIRNAGSRDQLVWLGSIIGSRTYLDKLMGRAIRV